MRQTCREKNMTEEHALLPAEIVYAPAEADAGRFADAYRKFQGIPGIEITAGGWCYFTFYAGKKGEEPGNFVLLYRRRVSDLGDTQGLPYLAVTPPAEDTRCFDPCLWIAPDGRLCLFWAQSQGHTDGRIGVWMSVCGDPDAEAPAFAAPRRIANGIMMNKPIVHRGGWLLPCAIWGGEAFEKRYTTPVKEELYSNVYRSQDNGETFACIGHSSYEKHCIDEHMMVERKDGSLLMFIRSSNGIGRAESYDGGVTWINERDSGLGGPCSRFCIRRLRSGALLLINHVKDAGRSNLAAMLSYDDGESWTKPLIFDERSGVSYPDAVEYGGRIYVIYDRNRTTDKEILAAVMTEADILYGGFVTPGSARRVLLSRAYGINE